MTQATSEKSGVHLREDFRSLLESAPDAMVIVDTGGEIILINAKTERLFGYQRAELLGEMVEILVPERFRGWHSGYRSEYSDLPQPSTIGQGRELFGRRKDGTEFPVEISLSPVQTDDGTLISSAIRDITERKRSDQEAAHFRAVVESSHDAIISKDLDGIIMSWNAGAERLYGYSASEAIGKPIAILVPPGQDDELPEILRRVALGEQVDGFETIRVRKDGTPVDVSLTISPMLDRHGNIIGASSIARDIGVRLRYQEQLKRLAEHDDLTGLRNRRRFERDVIDQLDRARRYGEVATLLMIDLNDFKAVNDNYGHRAGDRMLKAVAAGLTARMRESDALARIGGDEFAVLIPYASADQGAIIAQDLRIAIGQCQIQVDNLTTIRASASIGQTQINSLSLSDEDIIVEADRLMYEEKRRDWVREKSAAGAPRSTLPR